MIINSKARRLIRLQNLVTAVLFIVLLGLLGWASHQYRWQSDWTANNRNTLSQPSRKLLDTLDSPLEITAFARENQPLREIIWDLIGRYQRHKPDVTLNLINPDTAPEQVRRLGIQVDGELKIEYQGRTEQVRELDEESITNAIQRLARAQTRYLAFLQGHGERRPLGEANHDLGTLGRRLQRTGFSLQELNLSEVTQIPANTTAVVIASPQIPLLAGEEKIILDYIRYGGNLLWLVEPNEESGLEELAALLQIELLPGVVVDATTQVLGMSSPEFALVTSYPRHPITQDFDLLTLFPQARALSLQEVKDWQVARLLTTQDRSWTETGPISGEIRYDEGSAERAGPLTIGIALERPGARASSGKDQEKRPGSQRVLMVGDGDFLSNTYLGNGGNLELALRMFNWLSREDRFIRIAPKIPDDQSLQLSQATTVAIGFGFLFILPGVLLASGFAIWFARRRR